MINDGDSGISRNFWLALGLAALVTLAWQFYLAKKYSNPASSSLSQETTEPPPTQLDREWTNWAEPSNQVEWVKFESSELSLQIGPVGACLVNVVDRKFKNRYQQPLEYLPSGVQICWFQANNRVPFEILEKDSNRIHLRALLKDENYWDREVILQDRILKINNRVTHPVTVWEPEIVAIIANKDAVPDRGNASHENVRLAVSSDGHSFRLYDLSKDIQLTHVMFWALDRDYFTSLWSGVNWGWDLVGRMVSGGYGLQVKLTSQTVAPISWQEWIYFGPKQFDVLEEIRPGLGSLVDLGFFGFIGKHLLKALKHLFSITGNWGLAIVLLTVMVRLVVLPFNIMAFRSMSKLQKIQPELNRLKEQYKDDPLTLNQKTLELMRQHRANPFGGCLPILLQMPIFFALYQVLGHAIELYQAPFGLWIKDLSAKDPFYVLPLLTTILLWWQQKLTPSTVTDPIQAKLLSWMPVLFGLFTLNLPAGLNVYLCVSTGFGLAQQLILMKLKDRVMGAP